MYKVVYGFADLQDDNHIYSVGDGYPRTGYVPTPERVLELEGANNKIGRQLISKIESSDDKTEPIEEKPKKASKKKN